MADFPSFPREVLAAAFNNNQRMITGFEELLRRLALATEEAEAASSLQSTVAAAEFVLATPNAALEAGLVLTQGRGVTIAHADGAVTISHPIEVQGGNAAFILTGETTLILPQIGTLATLADVAASVSGAVISFNTRTGAVTLLSADVTDALGYTPTSVTGLTGVQSVAAFKTGLSLVKGDVGLGNVDNTADAAKNVLTATKLFTARNFTITGDGSWTVNFDGSGDVTAALTLATVNGAPGSFGGASKSLTATVNGKGLVTALAEQSIAITAAQVTDFSEATDDRIAALLTAGANISLSYNDAGNVLTIAVTGIGTTIQGYDADLAAIAGLTSAADKLPYFTGSGTAALADFTQGARAITALSWSAGTQVPALTAAGTASLKTVGAAAGNILDKAAGDSLYQPLDSDLTTIAGLTATTDNFIVAVAGAWASRTPAQVRTTLALVIGTNVQAWDADLDTWAGITPGSGVGTFLATPSSANLRSAVTDETGTGSLVFANTPTLVTPVLGTPTSGTLTNCTGLPISTGVSGLGSGIATFLATPSSANLASAITDETGTGSLVFSASPAFTGTATFAALTASGTFLSTAAAGAVNRQVNQSSGSIANNGTYDFPAGNYNFIHLYESAASGRGAILFTNGFVVNIVWQDSAALFSNALGTAGKINIAFNAGVIRIENKSGSACTFYIERLAGHS